MSAASDTLKMTPEDRLFLEETIQTLLARPNWVHAAILRALRVALDAVRLSLTTPETVIRFWKNPAAKLRFQIRWHGLLANVEESWSRAELEAVVNRAYKDRSHLVDSMLRYAEWFVRTKALRALTAEATYLIASGSESRVLPAHLSRDAMHISTVEREQIISESFRAVHLGPLIDVLPSNSDFGVLRETARRPSKWETEVVVSGQPNLLSLFAILYPMVCDNDRREAYFPVELAVSVPNELRDEAGWHPRIFASLWEALQEQVNSRLEAVGEVVPRHRSALETGDVIPLDSDGRHDDGMSERELLVVELRRMSDQIASLREGLSALPDKTPVTGAASVPRIVVNEESRTVILDGVTFALLPTQFEVVQILHKNLGGWVGQKLFLKHNFNGRVDRVIPRLPKQIRQHIEAVKGMGHRLVVEQEPFIPK